MSDARCYCLMHAKTITAIVTNKHLTPEMLIEAALACRCIDCNEALERYAHIQMRKCGNDQVRI